MPTCQVCDRTTDGILCPGCREKIDGGRFDELPPHQVHSDTSRAAAGSVAPTVAGLRKRVYDNIRAAGPHGRTDEEVQTMTGMGPSTQRPRRVELVRAGLVAATGTRRKTSSGRTATVWVATNRGE